MAWEWSHTDEAYQAVRDQIFAKAESGKGEDREWLKVVYAEWRCADASQNIHFHAEFHARRYRRALARAKHLASMELAEYIWNRAQDYRTCTNGGWEAYACPFGCGCHLVPFSPAEEEVEV